MKRPLSNFRPFGPLFSSPDPPDDKSCVFAISSEYSYAGAGDISDDKAFELLNSFENQVENNALINIEDTNLRDVDSGKGLECSFISSLSNIPLRQLNLLEESVNSAAISEFNHSETIIESMLVDKNMLPRGAQTEGINFVNCDIGFGYTINETVMESDQENVSHAALDPLVNSLEGKLVGAGFKSREGTFVDRKSNVLVARTEESMMSISEIIRLAKQSKDKLDEDWMEIESVSVIAR